MLGIHAGTTITSALRLPAFTTMMCSPFRCGIRPVRTSNFQLSQSASARSRLFSTERHLASNALSKSHFSNKLELRFRPRSVPFPGLGLRTTPKPPFSFAARDVLIGPSAARHFSILGQLSSLTSFRKGPPSSASSLGKIVALAKPERKPLLIAIGLLLVSSAVTMSVPFTIGKLIDYFSTTNPVSRAFFPSLLLMWFCRYLVC